jgi:hypothetical protein
MLRPAWLKAAPVGRFGNVAVDDYSLEAERQTRKIIAGGVINLR